MLDHKQLVSIGAALLFAGAASAQVMKGSAPPELAFEKVWNGGPQNFDELLGRVVILDFAQTW